MVLPPPPSPPHSLAPNSQQDHRSPPANRLPSNVQRLLSPSAGRLRLDGLERDPRERRESPYVCPLSWLSSWSFHLSLSSLSFRSRTPDLEVAKFIYGMYADRQEGREPTLPDLPSTRAVAPPAYEHDERWPPADDKRDTKTRLNQAETARERSSRASSSGRTVGRLMRRLFGGRGSKGCDCGHRCCSSSSPSSSFYAASHSS